MKVRVSIAGISGIALLDSGSSHNFIDLQTPQRARMILHSCAEISVTVANGDYVPSPGKAVAQTVLTDGEVFDIDLYALPLGEYNMVLGV